MKRWIIRKDGRRQRYNVKHPKKWSKNKVYDKAERGWAIAVQEVHVVIGMIGSDKYGTVMRKIGEVEMDFCIDVEHIDDEDYIYGEALSLAEQETNKIDGMNAIFKNDAIHNTRGGIHKGKKYRKGKQPEARVVPRYGN